MHYRALVTSLALAAASVVLAASSAQADSCMVDYGKTQTETYSHAYPVNCSWSQARIDRYYNGVVYSYLGSRATAGNWSDIINSTGTNAGNAYRYGGSGWGNGAWVWI